MPSATSAEFLNGGYLVQMNAAVAYNAGATGQGILVADVDTGADPTRPDLVGAISPLSTDIIAGRNQPVGDNGHADWVSSVLAARFNGFGTIGVAYESTVLSIRADTGSATNPSFDDSDIANGVEYAIQNHARVINLSLGSPGTSSPGAQRCSRPSPTRSPPASPSRSPPATKATPRSMRPPTWPPTRATLA